jgi:membrane associated rhomboid family serine protease
VLSPSTSTRRLTAVIGWTIALSWIVASLLAMLSGRGLPAEQQPALKYYALGLHPFSEGPIIIHLFAYSFIHGIGSHLIFNLLMLWLVISLARDLVTPAALVRLYSLGSLATGVIYLLVSSQINNAMPLIGAGGSLMAMIGAIAVLNPSQKVVFFFVKEMALPWAVAWVFVLQLLGFKDSPSLSIGMIAGLIAGLLYGAVERLFGTRNIR